MPDGPEGQHAVQVFDALVERYPPDGFLDEIRLATAARDAAMLQYHSEEFASIPDIAALLEEDARRTLLELRPAPTYDA
ncbi:hypothetical protein [uncultured Shimia sp.]|uniref:hypothetical protein n=1 Tax=uncultured Shimia sp. TaxID=573152 RepID=UPI00260682B0|nr:hypothetical protein [uncultured Shimia sp.]